MIPKIKVFKLKSSFPQKVGKILLWTLVVFLLLRGIGSMFRPNEAQAAKEVIKNFTGSKEYQDRVEFEAAAFSEGFAQEYVSYEGNNTDDYANRLKKYVASYLEFNIPSGSDTRTEALSSEALKVHWISKNQLNVDVKIKVRYLQKARSEGSKPGEITATDKITVSNTYLRVPVVEKDGKYLVEDYPAFIPEPETADIKFQSYPGKDAETATTKEITGVLDNFFKAYYNGNSGAIAYYLLDSSKQIKGLEKRYEFSKMDTVNVYLKEGEKKYFSICSLIVKDSINGQPISQKYHVVLVKKDDRYYIESFDVRTGNFNEQEK